jgi:hypothetical protein
MGIALDTYSHVLLDMHDHVIRALEDLLAAGLQYGCSKGVAKHIPALSSAAFHLQTAAFSKWAMLGSNQRPPPCKFHISRYVTYWHVR